MSLITENFCLEPLGLSSTVERTKGSLLKTKFFLVFLTQPRLYQ